MEVKRDESINNKTVIDAIKDKIILGLAEFLGIINPRGILGREVIKGIKQQDLYKELSEQYYQQFECFFNNIKNWKLEIDDESEARKWCEERKKEYGNLKKYCRELNDSALQYLYYEGQVLQEKYHEMIAKYGKFYQKQEELNGWSGFFEKLSKKLRKKKKKSQD